MKFNFKLQNVLLIKQKFEEQQKNQFMIAKRELNAKEEFLEVLMSDYSAALEESKKSRIKKISVRELKEMDHKLKYSEDRIIRQKLLIQKAQEVVDIEQEKLFEIMKERKTYEQLKEKEFEEYKIAMNVKEMGEIDELTSYLNGKAK